MICAADEWMTPQVIQFVKEAVAQTDASSRATLKHLCEFLNLVPPCPIPASCYLELRCHQVCSKRYVMVNKMTYMQLAKCLFAPFGLAKIGQVMILRYDDVF